MPVNCIASLIQESLFITFAEKLSGAFGRHRGSCRVRFATRRRYRFRLGKLNTPGKMSPPMPRPILTRPVLPRPLLPVLAAMLALLCPASPYAADTVDLRILAINDFHGYLHPSPGGIKIADPADKTRKIMVEAGGAEHMAKLQI